MASSPKLLDGVRDALRLRHYSIRTEEAYLRWITEFLKFHREKTGQWQHPRALASPVVNEFLTDLGRQSYGRRQHPEPSAVGTLVSLQTGAPARNHFRCRTCKET